MKIRLQLGSAFVHHFDMFLLRHNAFYLFDRTTLFDDVRIALYFDIFELRIEITLQAKRQVR